MPPKSTTPESNVLPGFFAAVYFKAAKEIRMTSRLHIVLRSSLPHFL